jgi:hypothetical protein
MQKPLKIGRSYSVARSPDGTRIATVGSAQEKRIAIYRIPDIKCVAEFPMPYPSDVVFLPELNLVALGDWQAGVVVSFES